MPANAHREQPDHGLGPRLGPSQGVNGVSDVVGFIEAAGAASWPCTGALPPWILWTEISPWVNRHAHPRNGDLHAVLSQTARPLAPSATAVLVRPRSSAGPRSRRVRRGQRRRAGQRPLRIPSLRRNRGARRRQQLLRRRARAALGPRLCARGRPPADARPRGARRGARRGRNDQVRARAPRRPRPPRCRRRAPPAATRGRGPAGVRAWRRRELGGNGAGESLGAGGSRAGGPAFQGAARRPRASSPRPRARARPRRRPRRFAAPTGRGPRRRGANCSPNHPRAPAPLAPTPGAPSPHLYPPPPHPPARNPVPRHPRCRNNCSHPQERAASLT